MTKILPSKFSFKKEGTQYRAENPHPGKVTGTAMGGILGLSPWDTPFSVACRLLRIYREDIDDKPAVKAGKVLESVIIDHINDTGRLEIIPAEAMYPERKGSHDEWEHDFEDEVFGGHVDGVTVHGDIVEVKTTSNPEPWLNGIPEHYWLQASLYAKFMGAGRIHFIVGVLGKDDTSNPFAWVPSDDNVFLFSADLHPDIDRHVEYIRGWYADYIAQGLTPMPDLDSEKDLEIISALDAQTDDPSGIIAELEDVERALAETKGLKERADELKAMLMLHMDYQKVDSLPTGNGTYTLAESTRTVVDSDKLKSNGLYSEYTKKMTIRTIKKRK